MVAIILAASPAHGDALAEGANLPDAIVVCAKGRCEVDLPFGGGSFRLCIGDADLPPLARNAVPELVDDQGKVTPMKRDQNRWCAPVARGTRVSIRAGLRTLHVLVIMSIPATPQQAVNTFTYLDHLPPDLPRQSQTLNAVARRQHAEPLELAQVMGQNVSAGLGTQVMSERGEPVSRPDTSQQKLEPIALPDDLAFLDVVAVGDASSLHCTGIAVAADAVLTASHCVPATHVDLAVRTAEVLRTARVRRTIVHPSVDVALLRLETSLPVTPRPRRRATDSHPPEGIVRAVGFGVDDPRKASGFGIKRRADVAVSGWGCDAGRSMSTGCFPASEMVIAAIGGRDTCWGDSGGPVLEPFGETWRLIAITSRPTLHGGGSCGRGGIYVRVDVNDAWLTQALEEKP